MSLDLTRSKRGVGKRSDGRCWRPAALSGAGAPAAVTAAIDTWTSSKHSCESNLIGKLRKVLFWACADAATSKKTSKKSSLSKKGKWRLKALIHQMKTGTALPNPNYVEPSTSAVANSNSENFYCKDIETPNNS